LGTKKGEATDYANLVDVFQSLGDYVKADEYHQKALVITKETGVKNGEAASYRNLGAR